MSSEAYQAIMSRITALEDAGKTKDERIAALESALKSAEENLSGRLTGVEQNYADIAKQISSKTIPSPGSRAVLKLCAPIKTTLKETSPTFQTSTSR